MYGPHFAFNYLPSDAALSRANYGVELCLKVALLPRFERRGRFYKVERGILLLRWPHYYKLSDLAMSLRFKATRIGVNSLLKFGRSTKSAVLTGSLP